MKVYLDVLFAINFACDFVILLCAGRLGGVTFIASRMLLSAAVGASYACLTVLPSLRMLTALPVRLLFALLMVITAYGFCNIRAFAKQLFLFLSVSFIAGGAAFAVALLSGGGMAEGGIIYFDFPLLYAVLGMALCFSVSFVISSRIKKAPHEKIIIAEIIYRKKHYRLRALYDSGNLLIDGISGLPLIVAKSDAIDLAGLRSVSCSTASGEGELKLFIPDRVILRDGARIYNNKDIAVGVSDAIHNPNFDALIGGMCFERAERKNIAFTKAVFRRKLNFLHRGSGAASATPDQKRGGGAFRQTSRK